MIDFFWTIIYFDQNSFDSNFYGRCLEGIGCHNVKMSVYLSICTFVYLSCYIFEASDWSKEGMLHRQGGH